MLGTHREVGAECLVLLPDVMYLIRMTRILEGVPISERESVSHTVGGGVDSVLVAPAEHLLEPMLAGTQLLGRELRPSLTSVGLSRISSEPPVVPGGIDDFFDTLTLQDYLVQPLLPERPNGGLNPSPLPCEKSLGRSRKRSDLFDPVARENLSLRREAVGEMSMDLPVQETGLVLVGGDADDLDNVGVGQTVEALRVPLVDQLVRLVGGDTSADCRSGFTGLYFYGFKTIS